MTSASDLQSGATRKQAPGIYPVSLDGWESCNFVWIAGIHHVVDTGINLNLVDIYGQMTRLDLARMHKLIGGRVRRMRTLQDCPEQSYGFRPFLLTSPDDPEFLFRPTAVDCGPMASALQTFLLENN